MFQSGIIKGLTLQAQPSADYFAVLPGRAIDAAGKILTLSSRQLLGVKAYYNQTVAVCLRESPSAGQVHFRLC